VAGTDTTNHDLQHARQRAETIQNYTDDPFARGLAADVLGLLDLLARLEAHITAMPGPGKPSAMTLHRHKGQALRVEIQKVLAT